MRFSRNSRSSCTAIYFLLTYLVICGLWCVPSSAAQQDTADEILSSPVNIEIVRGGRVSSGTGFYLSNKTSIYLVTAKHLFSLLSLDCANGLAVSEKIDGILTSYSKDIKDPQKNIFAFDYNTLIKDGNIRCHATRDVAVIKIADFTKNTGILNKLSGRRPPFYPAHGANLILTGGSGIVYFDTASVTKFSDILVGNDAIISGYPSSLGGDLNQFDHHHPLLRKALIAGTDTARRSIIIDGPSYRGNSGGPVFQINRNDPTKTYSIVGIIIEFIPLTEGTLDFNITFNSGYSVATPIDFALDLLQ